MENISIIKLYNKYIKDTEKEVIVANRQIVICFLTNAVITAINFKSPKVYINTRILKHLYDKRTAEEFNFMIHNIWKVVKYPDFIYSDKNSKRGQLAFVKNLGKFTYFCPIEIGKENNYVITIFRTDIEYLKNMSLFGAGRAAFLHLNTFDIGLAAA